MSTNKEHLWRNDITGLRALAVVPVLIYHAFPSLIPGGFFGVDIFFVISGFLISGIIFRGFKNDNFSWRTFYAKRVKRIFPNLILVLWATMLLGWFFMLNGEYRWLGGSVYSGAFFFENFQLLKGKGYFDDEALLNPLVHLWSLSVEEQFYIVFPLLAMGAVALGRRLEWLKTNARLLGAIAVAFITIGSFALCLGTESVKHAFYWPWTRFWEISAGIVLAYAEIYYAFKLNRGIRQTLAWAGLAMVLFAFWGYDASIRTPGLFSLLPVLGAVFLIAAKPDALVNRTVLSWKPVIFIGLISYSLYLWHWPLLSFATIVWGAEITPYVLCAALAVSAVISTVVFYAVENPMRFVSKENSRKVVIGLLIALTLTFVAGQALRLLKGFPNHGFRAQYPYLHTQLINKELKTLKVCHFEGQTFLCTNPDLPPSMILMGDSHAEHYVSKMKSLSENTGKNIAIMAHGGCWAYENEAPDSEGCRKVRETLPQLLAMPSVKVVVSMQAWGKYKQAMLEGVGPLLGKWKAQYPDKRFFVMEGSPYDKGFNWLKRINRLTLPKEPPVIEYKVRRNIDWDIGNKTVKASLPSGIEWLPTQEILCPNMVCNALMYQDIDHLSPYYLRDHASWLDEVEAYLKTLP